MSPRTGRPLKDDARHEKLNLRITEQEKEDIQKCADILNITRTDAIMQGIHLLMNSQK